MNACHPFRYIQGFSEQLARLERRSPGITRRSSEAMPSATFLEMEQTGSSRTELFRQNRLLRHLECLIADWRGDGEHAYSAQLGDALPDRHERVFFPAAPPHVSYVEFDDGESLFLQTRPRSRIEGFYIREVFAAGRPCAELTFVCLEPGWTTMDCCLFADAMEVASRVGIVTVPVDTELSLSPAGLDLRGDPGLAGDPALLRGVLAAGEFASRGIWNRVRTSCARSPASGQP